jgi:hypothetical protein
MEYRIKDSDYRVEVESLDECLKLIVKSDNMVVGEEELPPVALLSLVLENDLKNQLTLKSLRKAVDIDSHIEEVSNEKR